MAQSLIIGYVTADLEPQTSASGNLYVRFSLAEHIGHGDSLRTQFLQVWAWSEDAKRMINPSR